MAARFLGMGGGLLLGLVVLVAPALAQSVQVLGDYRDWSAYSAADSSGKICFAVTKPVETEPLPDGYSQAYLYLTHRSATGTRSEFNLIAGYTFAEDSAATATVGGQNFVLFTEADAAWLDDRSLNESVSGAIRAGSRLTIEGTSVRGIKVTQVFSLSGATAASRAITAECF